MAWAVFCAMFIGAAALVATLRDRVIIWQTWGTVANLLDRWRGTCTIKAMQARVIIPLEEFPEEGLFVEGEADGALFGIDNTGAQSVSPLSYSLEAQLYETELVLRGRVAATFRLRCDRCLREFDYEVELSELTISVDVKGKAAADVTEELREEVLLELPGYPKCEISGLECEINDTFCDFRLDKDPHSGVNSATPSGKSVWDALDDFPRK